jgi:hypothetical protein
MKRKKCYLIATVFLLLSGCTPYLYYDIEREYPDYREQSKEPVADQKAAEGTIDVTVIAPEKCACRLEKTNERKEIDESPTYQCIGFPLYYDDTKKEIKEIIENSKKGSYYVFDSFGEVVKACLEQQLSAYFNEANVTLESPEPANNTQATSVVSYYTEWFMTDNKIMYTKLLAISNDGNTIEAYGKAMNKLGNGHLAWLIPVGVITFPVGTIIGATIVDNKAVELMNKTLIESIDMAAAELSRKLAADLAQKPDRQYKVFIGVE